MASARARAWLATAFVAVALCAVLLWANAADWPPERALRLLRGTGWCAVFALAVSLCARPLATLAGWLRGRRFNIAPLRRLAGISAATLATLHAGVALTTYLQDAWQHVFSIAWLRAGACGLLVLMALWLTSFPRVTRALRIQHWKALHRLAYVAGLLAFQHALLSPFASRAFVLGAVGAILIIALARLLPTRRRPSGSDSTEATLEQVESGQPNSTPSQTRSQLEI